MDFPGRTTAALLLALFAMQGVAPHAQAAFQGKYACAASKDRGKRCVTVFRRGGASPSAKLSASRGAAFAGLPHRARKLYGGGEAAMPQLSPRLHPRRISILRFDDGRRDPCGQPGGRKGCTHERNLAEALIQPRNASTAKILRETGIPDVPDILPIVILRSTD